MSGRLLLLQGILQRQAGFQAQLLCVLSLVLLCHRCQSLYHCTALQWASNLLQIGTALMHAHDTRDCRDVCLLSASRAPIDRVKDGS